MNDQTATPLPLVLNRIATGVTFGAIVISIFFNIWALAQYGAGPTIGVFVFQVIALLSGGYLSARVIFEKCQEPKNVETVDFV